MAKTKITKHHRHPKSTGGITSPDNISRIPEDKHRNWHELFHNWSPEKICRVINEIYLDPEYEFVCRRKEVDDG